MVRADSFAGRLVAALAARPRTTTVSAPVDTSTRWAAALAARPVAVRAGVIGYEDSPLEDAAPRAGDLPAKVEVAWDDFARSLSEALEYRPVEHDADSTLTERVAAVVAGILRTRPEDLQIDSDGDIGIRAGSAMVFVRVRDNPPLVDVFSPVLVEVPANEKLYARLSELTNRMPIGRLYWASDTIWASVPVLGRDFQPTHLMLAIQVMTGLADELDDRLSTEFGGRRFFETENQAPQSADHLRPAARWEPDDAGPH